MHEDFYSVATTVVLFFLVGGYYSLSRYAQANVSQGVTPHALTFLILVMPTFFVVNVSLNVLAESWRDTHGWRVLVIWLVAAQMLGGGLGLLNQSLESRGGRTRRGADSGPEP